MYGSADTAGIICMCFPGSGCHNQQCNHIHTLLHFLWLTSPKHASQTGKPHCNANATTSHAEGGESLGYMSILQTLWQPSPWWLHVKRLEFPTAYNLSHIWSIDSYKPPQKRILQFFYSATWNKDKTTTCAHHVALTARFISGKKTSSF